MKTLLTLELPGARKLKSGKVREIFDLGDKLLLVATDRISAFDVVLPNGIPHKGEVLTRLSLFWFQKFNSLVPNHVLAWGTGMLETPPLNTLPAELKALLEHRAMLVKKARPLPVECVVRGYLSGSGWKEYCKTGTVCGVGLPAGLVESAELPEPIFTPTTKAEVGHDQSITFEDVVNMLGRELAEQVRSLSLQIYTAARDYARRRGIIIADTKFEFGLMDGQLILIDELLTPDSSRFWPADSYQPGGPQPSFDKQFVRDYLETLAWDKTPPGPVLPDHIVECTSAKYVEAYERLTGHKL